MLAAARLGWLLRLSLTSFMANAVTDVASGAAALGLGGVVRAARRAAPARVVDLVFMRSKEEERRAECIAKEEVAQLGTEERSRFVPTLSLSDVRAAASVQTEALALGGIAGCAWAARVEARVARSLFEERLHTTPGSRWAVF